MIKGFRQLGQRGRRAPRITLSLTSHLSKIILASQKADAGRSRVASKRFSFASHRRAASSAG